MPRGSLMVREDSGGGFSVFILLDHIMATHTRIHNIYIYAQSTRVLPSGPALAPRHLVVSSFRPWVQPATALRRERVISSTGHRCANHSHLALLSRASSTAPPGG